MIRSEPYRLFFPAAAAFGAVAVGAWTLALAGRLDLVAGPPDHAVAMLWGFLGTGVLGFLLTAYPRQNGAGPPPTPVFAAIVSLQGAFLAGVVLSALGAPIPGWRWLGVGLWTVVTGWSATVALPSLRRGWDDTTAAVPLALIGGAAGLALVAWGDARGEQVGVHGFLVVLALSFLDRLLPFFSSKRVPGYDGGRSRGFALGLVALAWLRLALPSPAVVDALLVAWIARAWLVWRPLQGLRVPLVGVLHVGVAWIVGAYGVEAVAVAAGWPIGTAATHAVVLGGITSLFLGLAIRVTRGHGGAELVLGTGGAVVFALAQAAAVARVGVLVVGASAWLVAGALLTAALAAFLVSPGPLVLKRA